jgi:hypothetical protein
MTNPLYNEFGPVQQGMPQDFMTRLNMLKQSVSDPNAMIQQMLNSGKVSQAQVNAATNRAQQIMQMLTPNGRR